MAAESSSARCASYEDYRVSCFRFEFPVHLSNRYILLLSEYRNIR